MNYPKILQSVMLLCGAAVLAGCGAQSRRIGDYTSTFSLDGLEQDRSELPVLIYVRPGAPGLGAYDRFIVDPIRVIYDDQKATPDSARVSALAGYFKDQLEGELKKSGYTVTGSPGPGTLRISTVISNVKVTGAVSNAANVATNLVAPITPAVGGVTVEAAFLQSKPERIDGVAIERSSGSRILNATVWSTEADVRSAFKQWAVGIRKSVDKAHGR